MRITKKIVTVSNKKKIENKTKIFQFLNNRTSS